MDDGSGQRSAASRIQHVLLLVIGVVIGCFLSIHAISSATEDRSASSAATQGPVTAEPVTAGTPDQVCDRDTAPGHPIDRASACAQVLLTYLGSLRPLASATMMVDMDHALQHEQVREPERDVYAPSLTGLSISRT